MAKQDAQWNADLDASDTGRPGSYAADRALEAADAAEHDLHWKQNYRGEPYCETGREYDYYAPAYRVGYEGCARYRDREFDDVERELQTQYERCTNDSHPRWSEARSAARAAWARMKNAFADRS